MSRADLVRCARGDVPPDLVLAGGRVVDVLGGDVMEADVAVLGDTIAGVGSYDGPEEIDLDGSYVAPGFIDAHVHVESSLVRPSEFARVVAARGTTTAVTDPHEIANVCGLDGIRFMLDDAEGAPCDLHVMASSCVPATQLETSGAELDAAALAKLRGHPRVLGLAEVMDYPSVVAAAEGVLDKIETFADRPVDGHCPGLSGPDLAAYAAAGPASEHECTTVEEAREKLRAGLMIFLREATGARNLRDLAPLVTERTAHRICLCTDDRRPAHLLDEGHVDDMVRTLVEEGVDPVLAIRLASYNAAVHFGLRDRGAVAPGRRADLVVFDSLGAPRPRLVVAAGRVVATDGDVDDRVGRGRAPEPPTGTVDVDWDRVDLTIAAEGERARAIGVVPGQLLTESLVVEVSRSDGEATADPDRDLLKIAVIERHGRSRRVGKGFVQGLGLRRGAVASTIAHDHHNLIVAGADDVSMTTAARRAAELGGGLAVAVDGEVSAELPLPIAGLMSDGSIDRARCGVDAVNGAARELGSELDDPLMSLSFLGLEVIPSLKITDHGLVDVDRAETVPLWCES